MRGLVSIRGYAPICFDATHSAQYPGAGAYASDGDRSVVAPLARAAVAVGIDALFVEVHRTPESAPCDSACQLQMSDLDRLLGEVCVIQAALPARRQA